MGTGIEIFYTVCAAAGSLFTLISALGGRRSSRFGRAGHRQAPRIFRGHSSGKAPRAPGRGVGRRSGGRPARRLEITASFFTPLTGAVFTGSLGYLGLIARSGLHLSPEGSLLFAAPLSVLASLLLATVFVKVFVESEGSSHVIAEEARGLQADVVTKIESGRVGSIVYVDKGARRTLPARGEADETFERGEAVFITRVEGAIAYVRRERGSMWEDLT